MKDQAHSTDADSGPHDPPMRLAEPRLDWTRQILGEGNREGIAVPQHLRASLRIPYGLRRVPVERLATVLPLTTRAPRSGDLALAQLEKIGKNTRLELASGRAATLHVGDLMAVVFGNRYATMQFEGYARVEGDRADLLSMGGLCGLVESKHASVADSSKLRILGMLGDETGRALNLRDFSIEAPKVASPTRPRVIAVCGSSMDAGKTYTASSIINGLQRELGPVAGIKLTGTAAGRDTWSLLDAGAKIALDFVDGGYPSTYLANLGELLDLHRRLLAVAAAAGAEWVVVEIADGLLQRETAELLACKAFRDTVDAWVFAAGDPLAAVSGVGILDGLGIRPLAISGRVTMSPLCVRETRQATEFACVTASELQEGWLNDSLLALDGEARVQRRAGAA